MEIYVHIPFCKKKCKYCDFVSFCNKEDKIEKYFESLNIEIISKSKVCDEEITSVYFGGGTPTCVPPYFVCDCLKTIKDNFSLLKNAEITIEGNPKTFDEKAVIAYKNAGFNRFSIGVQSFNDDELINLGRIHNKDEAVSSIKTVAKHFENFSIDLMIGLQGQNKEKIDNTIGVALSLNPKHISCYMLIVEENTPLFKEVEKGEYKPLSNDDIAIMFEYIENRLEKEGYIQYEISNFGKDGYFSKHNLGYWNMTNYLGFGLNAHSLINNERFYNTNNIDEYIKNPNNSLLEEKLTMSDYEKEYIMLSLRTIFGVDLNYFKQKFDKDFLKVYKDKLDKLKNCLIIDRAQVAIKREYFAVSNAIIVEFM